jgi:hypothetical protein
MATRTAEDRPGQVSAARRATGNQLAQFPGTGAGMGAVMGPVAAASVDGCTATTGRASMEPAWATTAGPSTVARQATVKRAGRRSSWVLSREPNVSSAGAVGG